MKIRLDGAAALVACSLFWSTGGILIKFIDASSFAIAGIRSFIALCIFMAVLKRRPVIAVKNNFGGTDVRGTFAMWAAGFFYAATMILYCMANKLTTAANTILLQYTNPIYIILFGPVILGEKNSKLDYMTCLGVLGGIILFFSGDIESGNRLGNILALFSGVTFGFCTIFMRFQKTTGSENSFMLAHLMTALFGIPFAFTSGPVGAVSVLALIAMGVFQMAAATLLYSRGISKVKALSASIITMIEPLMNPVWVMLFAKEIPSATCIAGGTIILGCILVREGMSAHHLHLQQ